MGPYVSQALGLKQPQPQPQSRQERREQQRQERRQTERQAQQSAPQQSQPQTRGDEAADVIDLRVPLDVPYGTLLRPQRNFRIAMLLDMHASGSIGAEECMRKMNVRKQDKRLFMLDLRLFYEGFQGHLERRRLREEKRPLKREEVRITWMKKILGET